MFRPSLCLLALATLPGATLLAQHQAPNSELLRVPGSDVLVRLSSVDGAPQSAFSRDGGRTWTEQYAPRNVISMRTRVFDPLVGDATIPPQLMAGSENRLFYVQFKTEIIQDYRDALLNEGVEVIRYFPHHSYIVRMERSDVARIASQDFVRAVVDMHVGYKLEESVVAQVLADGDVSGRYDLMLANKHTDADAVEQLVRDLGGTNVSPASGSILVSANLTSADQLLTLASSDKVLWVEPLGPAETDINNLRIQAGVNYVEGLIGRDFGQGITGHIVEGVYATHCEFGARPPYRTTPVAVLVNGNGANGSGHGTNTAGEIFAEGLNAQARGILPYGQMLYTNYTGTINGTNERYGQTQRLVNPFGGFRAVIQTASWGYPRSTAYTSRSAEMDDILADMDLLVTNSQSNSGSTPSRPQAWAKNVIGVGGFNHFNNTNPADDCHCNTGSTGPAQDGRVGVTFASYYDSILTTSGTGCSYSGSFGGTSGATPTVNGLAGATIEMWTDGEFGYPAVVWQDRFDFRPHYTTTRALMAVGTRQLTMGNATRFEQGWGLPNLQDLYDNKDNILAIDELDVLTASGQSAVYMVWVPAGTSEFRASMHHAEEAAVPNAIPTRLNSVDLNVHDLNGNVWRGNEGGLITNQFTQSTSGVNNDIDIHENVFLQNPASGIYLVEVNLANFTTENHKETELPDFDFGLAIRGIGGGRDTSGMTLDIISNAPGQWDFSVANLPGGWTEGYTFLSFSTPRPVGMGHFLGIIPDAATLASLNTNAGPGKLLHFTNSAGYPNATFSWPASVANTLSGVTVDGFVMLVDGSGNVVSVSNVDRETIQ